MLLPLFLIFSVTISINSKPQHDRQMDYQSHMKLFRSMAKTYRIESNNHNNNNNNNNNGTSKSRDLSETSKEERKSRAKTFGSSTLAISETPAPVLNKNQTIQREDNKIKDNTIFDHLEVPKPDICGNCPNLWINNTDEMKNICSNYDAVSTFFSMGVDKASAKNIDDSNNHMECTRTVTCSQSHMLVKWKDSDICDVHAPTTGTDISPTINISTPAIVPNTFTFKCNGTHWSMHGFPLSSVICAVATK